MSEKRPYDPADIEVVVHTRPDGLRFFSVAGLKRGREYELLAIVAKMQTEDAASGMEACQGRNAQQSGAEHDSPSR